MDKIFKAIGIFTVCAVGYQAMINWLSKQGVTIEAKETKS